MWHGVVQIIFIYSKQMQNVNWNSKDMLFDDNRSKWPLLALLPRNDKNK